MGWYPHARGGVACGGQGRTLARSQMYARGLYPVILQPPHILTVKSNHGESFDTHTTHKSLTRPHESGPCVLYPACRSFKRVNGARRRARARPLVRGRRPPGGGRSRGRQAPRARSARRASARQHYILSLQAKIKRVHVHAHVHVHVAACIVADLGQRSLPRAT